MGVPAVPVREGERERRIARKRLMLEERRLDAELRRLERRDRGCCCCWVPLLPLVPAVLLLRWVLRKLRRWLALD